MMHSDTKPDTDTMAYLRLLLVSLLLLLHPPSSMSSPCNQTTVTAGDTWVEISWSLHCQMNTTDMVSYYHLSLTDTTAGIYNQDTNQYCMEAECSFLFTLARPCIHYTINLQLIDLETTTYDYEENQVTTDEEGLSAPRLLKSTGSSTNTLELTWYAPSTGEYCVKEYQVCSSTTARSTDPTCKTEKSTNTILASLLPCMEYRVTVTPVSAGGVSGLNAFVTAVTEDADPERPGGVTVEDRGYDYISLEWVKPETNKQCIKGVGAKCVESSFLPQTTIASTTPTTSSPTDPPQAEKADTSLSMVSNLAACTVYTCWVEYPDTNGGWIKSDMVEHWTWVKGVTISQPSSVTNMVGTHFMQVFWGAPSQSSRCVDEYILTWSDDTVSEDSPSVSVPADTYSYTIDILSPCVEYQVDIKALSTKWGQEKTGASATFSQRTEVETPGPVTGLQLISVTEDSFTMGWSPPALGPQCVDHYDYKVSDGPLVEDCVQPHVSDGQLQAHVGCLQCGASYTFNVWAVDALDGNSPPSQVTDIQTGECGSK